MKHNRTEHIDGNWWLLITEDDKAHLIHHHEKVARTGEGRKPMPAYFMVGEDKCCRVCREKAHPYIWMRYCSWSLQKLQQ